MMKRRLSMVLAAAALVVGTAGTTGAASASEPDDHHQRTVTTSPASWVLTSASCRNLPPGTTLTGEGTLTDVKTTSVDDGRTTERFRDHAEGTATDQDGNTYTWRYDNVLRISNTLANPSVFSGKMTDSFRLSGNGPVRLRNGFVGRYTEDRVAGTFAINPISSFGDPFDFPSGLNLCDPL